jgi:hypothetical protein
MPSATLFPLRAAVEGIVDELVLRKMAQEAGADLDSVYGRTGKGDLDKNLAAYKAAATHWPWVIMRDMDTDAACAPELISALSPNAEFMCYRVVVHALEAWLMADRQRMAAFLGVRESMIPASVEDIQDPKHRLIQIAAGSRRLTIRRGLIPKEGGGRNVGPEYTAIMSEFIQRHWRPAVAETNSASLRKCRLRLGELIQRARAGLLNENSPLHEN